MKKRVFPNNPEGGAAAADGAAAAPEIIFDIPIDVDGVVQYLKLHRGDVLGDRVKEFAAEHKLSDEVAQKMLEVSSVPFSLTLQFHLKELLCGTAAHGSFPCLLQSVFGVCH